MKKLLLLMFIARSLSPALLNAFEDVTPPSEPTEEPATDLIEAQDDFWGLVENTFQKTMTDTEIKNTLYKVIPILVRYGNPIQNNYFNPLYYAVLVRDPELTRFLIQYGANPNFRDMSGRSALSALPLIEVAYPDAPIDKLRNALEIR